MLAQLPTRNKPRAVRVIYKTVTCNLKKKLTLYLYILITMTYLSCNSDLNKSSSDLDSIKTTELLKQIFIDNENEHFYASCISEKPEYDRLMNDSNIDFYIKEFLKIKDTLHLKNQLRLFHNFRISKKNSFGKTILTKDLYNQTLEKANGNITTFWQQLENKCSRCMSITKPIFNETFDTAIVYIGTVNAGLMGYGQTQLYQFKMGKWIKIESLDFWFS